MDSMDFLSAVSQIPALDMEYALAIMGGSEVLYEKTIKQMIRSIPSSMDQMDAFLHDGEKLNDFAIKVHGMKSSLRQIGYLRLAKQAEDLEMAAKANDHAFCLAHYDSFREALCLFNEQVRAIMPSEAEVETAEAGEIKKYNEVLTQIKADIMDYDVMAASEKLMPFTKRRFDTYTDNLIAQAMESLDSYKAPQALVYITELLQHGSEPAL